MVVMAPAYIREDSRHSPTRSPARASIARSAVDFDCWSSTLLTLRCPDSTGTEAKQLNDQCGVTAVNRAGSGCVRNRLAATSPTAVPCGVVPSLTQFMGIIAVFAVARESRSTDSAELSDNNRRGGRVRPHNSAGHSGNVRVTLQTTTNRWHVLTALVHPSIDDIDRGVWPSFKRTPASAFAELDKSRRVTPPSLKGSTVRGVARYPRPSDVVDPAQVGLPARIVHVTVAGDSW